MARPKKLTSSETTAGNEEKTVETSASLEQQIAMLQKQLADLLAFKSDSGIEGIESESDTIKISGDEYIKVMSLCPFALNLTTQAHGQGKIFRFKAFGEIKRILYSDLVNIIELHQSFLEQGLFYIMDKRVIRRHGLDDIYAKILPKEKIEKVLSGDSKEAITLFQSATEEQQKIIIDIITAKVRDNAPIDFNVVSNLSRVSKIDIQGKAELAKQYMTEEA